MTPVAVFEPQLAYWRERLAGASVVELRTDRRRAGVDVPGRAWVPVRLDREVTDRLTDLVHGEGLGLDVALFAAFVALQHRYTDQDDLVVGSLGVGGAPSAGDPMPVRLDVARDVTGRTFMARVGDVVAEALDHDDISFHELAKDLQPHPGPARRPLYQTLFLWGEQDDLEAFTRSEILDHGTSMLDLSMALMESRARVEGVVEFNTDLFDRETIEAFVAHFGVVVASLVADPDRAVSRIEVLTDGERKVLLEDWNDTAAAIPDGCLHELIESQVAATPQGVAVVSGEASLRYGGLNARANQLAHHLAGLGVRPGALVGLCVDRGLDMVVGILGILKAGAAYVPVDALLDPPERIAFVLRDAGVQTMVAHRGLVDRLPGGLTELVCLDDPDQAAVIAQAPVTNPASGVTPSDLAYVIYTSGSTGTPKGVMVEHRALANLRVATRPVLSDLGPGQRLLQLAPVSVDISVSDILLSLSSGATLHIAPIEALLSRDALAEQLRADRITHMAVAPSVLGRIPEPHDFPDLATVVVGAERCDAQTVHGWAPGRRFFNGYGATETTIAATYHECVTGEAGDPPIGRPLPNARVYVVDRDLQLVPIGVAGELCVAGACVARGYLGRPDLTEERFVPDPFGPRGQRLYRTGDRGRWRRDGTLELLGRLADRIQVRGYRVDLGEIEAALRTHPYIRDVAVIAREDTPGDVRLVAYITTTDTTPSGPELRAHLAGTLPHYMVPAAFVVLDALPLTPGRKVDRLSLPTPTSDRPDPQVDDTAPLTTSASLHREHPCIPRPPQ